MTIPSCKNQGVFPPLLVLFICFMEVYPFACQCISSQIYLALCSGDNDVRSGHISKRKRESPEGRCQPHRGGVQAGRQCGADVFEEPETCTCECMQPIGFIPQVGVSQQLFNIYFNHYAFCFVFGIISAPYSWSMVQVSGSVLLFWLFLWSGVGRVSI